MNTTFQVEAWSAALPELRELFPLLWDEVALDKERFVSKCDEPLYANMEKLNMLHVVTARKDGKIIGYHVSFITPHMHYEGAGLFAFTDMYWTRPECRRGGLGAKLLCFLEQSWRERGIVKAYLSHKVAHDRSELFEALGWKPSDRVYCKVIL